MWYHANMIPSTAQERERLDVSLEKMKQAKADPFAMELAQRMALAHVQLAMGDSFTSLYQRYRGLEIGDLWFTLVIVALEDKKYGRGNPESIKHHPVLNAFPALQDIDKLRQSDYIVRLAIRFQTAYETMEKFTPTKPTTGHSRFDTRKTKIDRPTDLWVVLAKLQIIIGQTA